MFFSKKKLLKLLFLVVILLLDVKKLIQHKKYAAKAQNQKILYASYYIRHCETKKTYKWVNLYAGYRTHHAVYFNL
jgi:hypothetical protein